MAETIRRLSGSSDAGDVLTEEEAAAFLRTTPRKMRRLRAEGKIAFSRVGRTPVFTIQQLHDFVARNEVRPFRQTRHRAEKGGAHGPD